MNDYYDEIANIIQLVYSNGEKLVETYSFRIVANEFKRNNSYEKDWRSVIAESLSERYIKGLVIYVYDKCNNRKGTLDSLNEEKLRTLYMELLCLLDIRNDYEVGICEDTALFSVTKAQ